MHRMCTRFQSDFEKRSDYFDSCNQLSNLMFQVSLKIVFINSPPFSFKIEENFELYCGKIDHHSMVKPALLCFSAVVI